MFYQVKQYIKFLLHSTNQHGVHSPFVYNLVTKCFYDKKKHKAYNKIANYRNALLKDHTKLNVTDLGAGSRTMTHKQRSISSILKHASTTHKRAKLLYRFVQYTSPKSTLEIGTALGVATYAMALGQTKYNTITTVEGCSSIHNFTKNKLDTLVKNINCIHGNFNDELKKLAHTSYDLIFFDGNHQKEATLEYFEALLPTAHNDSIFIFDDIYWSKGMTAAWEVIKKHPKVTVTIDTFKWGIVFFRTEQVKEHFKIRV